VRAAAYNFMYQLRWKLRSDCADTQLKLQENLREVQAYSSGGDINCTLPPQLGAISAALDPASNVNCAQGVGFEVCILQEDACARAVCCCMHWLLKMSCLPSLAHTVRDTPLSEVSLPEPSAMQLHCSHKVHLPSRHVSTDQHCGQSNGIIALHLRQHTHMLQFTMS